MLLCAARVFSIGIAISMTIGIAVCQEEERPFDCAKGFQCNCTFGDLCYTERRRFKYHCSGKMYIDGKLTRTYYCCEPDLFMALKWDEDSDRSCWCLKSAGADFTQWETFQGYSCIKKELKPEEPDLEQEIDVQPVKQKNGVVGLSGWVCLVLVMLLAASGSLV